MSKESKGGVGGIGFKCQYRKKTAQGSPKGIECMGKEGGTWYAK